MLEFPAGPGIRVETGFAQGCAVTPYYDPMIAKLIVHADTRAQAIARLQQALAQTRIEGVKHNIPFIQRVLQSDAFQSGDVHTGLAAQVLAA
ncbi:Acetyl-/propionyl-coenzyme A carboxylase alpha chain [compost metagenome]